MYIVAAVYLDFLPYFLFTFMLQAGLNRCRLDTNQILIA